MKTKFIFVSLAIIVGLFTFRLYQSDDLSLLQRETMAPEVAQSAETRTISRLPEKSLERDIEALDTELNTTDEASDYIQIPQPLSEEPLTVARQEIPFSQRDTSKVIYVPQPMSDIPLEITVDTNSVEESYYIQIPQPLSDEPLYVARQDTQYSQGEASKVIYVPQPLSNLPLEITENTEVNDYIQIPQPLSDEPLILEVQ